MQERCLILANPVAGSYRADLVDDVAKRCAERYSVDTLLTEQPGSSEALLGPAFDTRPDLLVVIGGDGTVRDTAESTARLLGRWPAGRTAGSGPAMFVVPGGTGNSWYRALWGDRPWEESLTAVLSGSSEVRVRDIDMLRIAETDHGVLLGAATGFIAEVTAAAKALPEVAGRSRYVQAMATVFGTYRPYPGQVTVDGEVVFEGTTTLATIGGGRHRVGTFEVLPRSVLDDGLLDVCAVTGDLTDEGRAEIAGHIMGGNHVGQPGVTYVQGRQVTLTRTDGESLRFEHDGEVGADGYDRLTLEIVAGAVPMVAPAEPVFG